MGWVCEIHDVTKLSNSHADNARSLFVSLSFFYLQIKRSGGGYCRICCIRDYMRNLFPAWVSLTQLICSLNCNRVNTF